MTNSDYQARLEQEFLNALRHHLAGLHLKVAQDFSQENFEKELQDLEGDAVYQQFALASPEYVLIRLMGRMSISIGRRLGEIYDKLPRFIAIARFGLAAAQIAPKINGLELDIGLKFSLLQSNDIEHIEAVATKYLELTNCQEGLGIEIRYNFNPNDSARLRKDVAMAEYLQELDLVPIYLIFSGISPREEAISRLERAGWKFLIGEQAIDFAESLLGLDLARILQKPNIKAEVEQEIRAIMDEIFVSYAFQQALARHK